MQTSLTVIEGYPYPNKISHFRSRCRNYDTNQFWIKSMEYKMKCSEEYRKAVDCENDWAGALDSDRVKYRVLKENIACVERTIEQITDRFGEEAADMIQDAYIKGIKQEKIAKAHHMTIAVLQRKYRIWLESIFYPKDGGQA